MCGPTRRRASTRSRVSCRTSPTVTRRPSGSRGRACGCCGGSRCASTTRRAFAPTSRARPGAAASAPRWAERRTDVRGRRRALRRGRSGSGCTWTGRAGRPQLLPDRLRRALGCVGERAAGTSPTCATPRHRPTPRFVPWPLRATDLDVLDHVNNAAYWAPVEEELARRSCPRVIAAEIEFRGRPSTATIRSRSRPSTPPTASRRGAGSAVTCARRRS